jgi:phosphopantetheinyl transferase (holo-ACP synthase)
LRRVSLKETVSKLRQRFSLKEAVSQKITTSRFNLKEVVSHIEKSQPKGGCLEANLGIQSNWDCFLNRRFSLKEAVSQRSTTSRFNLKEVVSHIEQSQPKGGCLEAQTRIQSKGDCFLSMRFSLKEVVSPRSITSRFNLKEVASHVKSQSKGGCL